MIRWVYPREGYIAEYDTGRRDYIKLDSVTNKRCGFSLAFKCRRFFELYDYPEPVTRGAMSSVALVEYNCKDRVWRLIRLRHYERNMGAGKLLFEEKGLGNWSDVSIDSPEKLKLDFVCR